MKITFKKKASKNTGEQKIEYFGEVCQTGLDSYATYEQIRDAIVKEIVKRLENDISLRVEALRPEIAKIIMSKDTNPRVSRLDL